LKALLGAVPAGSPVLLDTSVLLAHLGQPDRVSAVATALIEDCLMAGRNPGVISTITVGELLVRPHRADRQAVDTILGFLWSMPDLLVRSVDFLVAAEAARMRAARQLSVPDSLILATGVLVDARVVATNDRALAAGARALTPDAHVLLLGDLSA
jgi:predicted nucleic acid-binding protein